MEMRPFFEKRLFLEEGVSFVGKKSYLKLLCYILLVLPVLSGCGKQKESSQLGIDGYVYTTQQIDLKQMTFEKFKVAGDYVYYRSRNSEGRRDELRRFPVEEMLSMKENDSLKQSGLPVGESCLRTGGPTGYIRDYTVDEEGCLYYLMERLDVRDIPILRPLEGMDGLLVDDVEEKGYILIKQQPDGSEEFCVSLPGRACSVALGREDRIYVLTEDFLFAIDEKGRLLEKISVAEGEIAELLEGEAGAVYYEQVNVFDNAVQEVVADRQSGSYRLERLAGPCSDGMFSGSRQGLFYTGSDGMLYRYRKENGSWETVLCWGDSNLACDSDFTMLLLSEDRMAVELSVFGQSGLQERKFYLLAKTPVEELPEKEVLVMEAGDLLYDKLEQYVMEFNRNSEDYHITIRHTDPTRLDAELVSSNPPDLINLTYMDYVKYGQKDVLEDLMPYLEGSNVLDKEDFIESVLEACTVKGRLVCIPDEITCTTVIGRTSQLGSRTGWSAAEAMALAESHSRARLFINNSFSAMMREFFRDYILEAFVDWERGECYFDSEEFIAFIKWVVEHSDGADIPMETLLGTMPEERLLDILTLVNSLETLMIARAYFGEEITVAGYPTVGGGAVHHGTAINQLGIVAASDKKEGAWQFIESFLAREQGIYTFLPARRDRLEEMAAKEAERGIHIILGPDMAEDYDCIPEEDLEQIYAIIDKADFTPREGIREEIINIIVEEMSPCLSGAREYEDAADIVQNRVKNMVQE